MDVIDTRDLGFQSGFDLRAYLVPDVEVDPMSNGDYSEEDIDAWRRGDWHYVHVVLTASRDGVELGSASLAGCEYGWFPNSKKLVTPLDGNGPAFANGYGPTLVDEAIANARETISHINR